LICLAESLAEVQREIAQRLEPVVEALTLVEGIPGLQAITAGGILAEIGVEMERFPSDKHLSRLRRGLSWKQAKRGQALRVGRPTRVIGGGEGF
jgi:transposase